MNIWATLKNRLANKSFKVPQPTKKNNHKEHDHALIILEQIGNESNARL